MESKIKNKTLSVQSREIVSNIFKFMTQEFEKGECIIPLQKVQERVSAATGVSIRTLRRVVRETEKIDSGEASGFKVNYKSCIPRMKPKTDLDETDIGLLRRTIQNFYITEKKVPTLKRMLAKFSEDTGYAGSKESLRNILQRMGYRWRKTKTNRKLLMERNDIANLRCTFLRNLKQYRNEKRPIIYMDETYIYSSHTNQKGWDDNTNTGLAKSISKGERIIIVNAGNENGFVPGAYARWRSTSVSGDYHHDMNFNNYKKWLNEQLLPNLPNKSVLVIDNAPYHNKQIRKCPVSTTRKAEMVQWLRQRNINFCEKLNKPELYNIIKQYKPRFHEYEVDKLLNELQLDVLRLPPYHPDLNPIELVWASLKQYVATKNVTFKRNDVEILCDEFFSSFSKEEWETRCKHSRKIEEEFIEKQPRFDEIIDELIINLGEDSDESDEFSESESDQSDIEMLGT